LPLTPPELQTADVSGSVQSDFCVQLAPALAAPASQTPGLRVQFDALVQFAPALTASILQAPDLVVQALSALQETPSLPEVEPHLPSLVQALFLIVVLPVQAMAPSLVQ
jgi:hypothetical protein